MQQAAYRFGNTASPEKVRKTSDGLLSEGLLTWNEPPRLERVNTSEPIVVPGTCGGADQVYNIVKGRIPEELQPLLSKPFTERERENLFHMVDLHGAEHVLSPERPKALWIFGPPAVGKTTMAEEMAIRLFGRPGNAVSIDGDEIRLAHEGFQRVVQHGLLNGVVHADAWAMLKKSRCTEDLKNEICKKAIQNRQNVKIPDATVNTERVRSMLNDLEAANYDLYAICLWAPACETQVRGRSRSVKAGKVFSTNNFQQSAEGALEFAHHWESQIRQGKTHYKSVAYYDNTVKPSHPVHLAQFEILTKMTWEQGHDHWQNCKAASEAYEKVDVLVSKARADGLAPKHVARLWLTSAKQELAEKRRKISLQTSTPNTMSQAGTSSATIESPIELVYDLLRSDKSRGRIEGLALGVLLTLLLQLLRNRAG